MHAHCVPQHPPLLTNCGAAAAGPFDRAWRYAKSTLRSGNIALHGGLAAILVVGVVAFDTIGDSLWANRNKGVSAGLQGQPLNHTTPHHASGLQWGLATGLLPNSLVQSKCAVACHRAVP